MNCETVTYFVLLIIGSSPEYLFENVTQKAETVTTAATGECIRIHIISIFIDTLKPDTDIRNKLLSERDFIKIKILR